MSENLSLQVAYNMYIELTTELLHHLSYGMVHTQMKILDVLLFVLYSSLKRGVSFVNLQLEF